MNTKHAIVAVSLTLALTACARPSPPPGEPDANAAAAFFRGMPVVDGYAPTGAPATAVLAPAPDDPQRYCGEMRTRATGQLARQGCRRWLGGKWGAWEPAGTSL